MITKVPQGSKIENIQQRLLNMLQANMNDTQRELVQKLTKNISIFNEPPRGQDLSDSFDENRSHILQGLSKVNPLFEGV